MEPLTIEAIKQKLGDELGSVAITHDGPQINYSFGLVNIFTSSNIIGKLFPVDRVVAMKDVAGVRVGALADRRIVFVVE